MGYFLFFRNLLKIYIYGYIYHQNHLYRMIVHRIYHNTFEHILVQADNIFGSVTTNGWFLTRNSV